MTGLVLGLGGLDLGLGLDNNVNDDGFDNDNLLPNHVELHHVLDLDNLIKRI